MSNRSIDNYAATLAIAVGQQEAALHRPQRPQRPLGIENCATGNCQNQSTGAVPDNGRPWWFWLAVGAGVGGIVYMASKSGMFRNPDDDDDLDSYSAAQRAAAISVQAGIPTILWGSPGIGKTAWLESLGIAVGAADGVFTVIGSTRDPADIAGMMTLEGVVIPPIWAQHIRQRSLDGEKSVLFLDEFSSMTPMVHAAMLRVVQEKVAGDCEFDPKYREDGKTPTKYRGNAVYVVCAANPKSQGAQAIDLPAPAANRMLHIDWPTPTAKIWAAGIMRGFELPKIDALPLDWKKSSAVKDAKKDIAAFLTQTPTSQMLVVPKSAEKMGREWPSPRSWEMAADALGAARFVGASRLIQSKLIVGCVGVDSAIMFFDWIDKKKEYNKEINIGIDSLISDFDATAEAIVTLSDKTDKLYHVTRKLTSDIFEKPSEKRWSAAWKLIDHMAMNMTGRAHDYSKKMILEEKVQKASMAPIIVMASDLLDLLNDPQYKDVLKGVKLPNKALLEMLEYEDINLGMQRGQENA